MLKKALPTLVVVVGGANFEVGLANLKDVTEG